MSTLFHTTCKALSPSPINSRMAFKADRLSIYVYIAKAMSFIEIEDKMWNFFLDRVITGMGMRMLRSTPSSSSFSNYTNTSDLSPPLYALDRAEWPRPLSSYRIDLILHSTLFCRFRPEE